MSISILNRGASGGLKPELTVTAPAGSTIDLLQGGIIVDTYTLGASETEHTFSVKLGTYTTRATLGADTRSHDVVIDTVGRYSIKLEYRLWLYRAGDECEETTGGWVLQGGGNGGGLVKNSDHMVLTYNVDTAWAKTANQSIMNPYFKTFYAEVKAEQVGESLVYQNFQVRYVSTSEPSSYITSTSYYTQTLDISALIGQPFNVWFRGEWYSGRNGRIYIKNVWLE